MALPPEWWADTEEDSILVGDRDDVGCIEISTLHKEQGEFDLAEAAEIARSESAQALEWSKVSLGDFEGVVSQFVEEGAAIREWYVVRRGMLLFITYSCDEDNRGMDDAAVDELLDTLTLVETP
tara:strand:+ start:6270 stop:6641 length:372 start_codon:yes stop_codon:yes gene_type:complete